MWKVDGSTENWQNQFSINDKIKKFIKIVEITCDNISNEHLLSFPNLEPFETEHKLQVKDYLIKNTIVKCSKQVQRIF